MIFWISIGILSLLAMGAVILPLLLNRKPVNDQFDEDQVLYRARIVEIESDLKIGRLDEADASAAKAELARKLIRAKQAEEIARSGRSRLTMPALVCALLFVPVFSLAIYGSLGTPPNQQLASQSQPENEQASIQTLLAAAEKRLVSKPDDAQGWIVIAPVYARLGRYDQAITAYRNAIRLEGRNPDFVFGLGEAIMSRANGEVTSEAFALFQEAAELDPQNPVARFYVGVHAMQQDDSDKAISIWQAIVDGATGDEDWLPAIKGRIAELERQVIATQTASNPEDQIAMINGMVAGLEEKLKEAPNDQEGWEMLIRSYLVLERFEDAKNIVARAKVQFSEDSDFLAKLDGIEAAILIDKTKDSTQ